jgi:hypothetical protein
MPEWLWHFYYFTNVTHRPEGLDKKTGSIYGNLTALAYGASVGTVRVR